MTSVTHTSSSTHTARQDRNTRVRNQDADSTPSKASHKKRKACDSPDGSPPKVQKSKNKPFLVIQKDDIKKVTTSGQAFNKVHKPSVKIYRDKVVYKSNTQKEVRITCEWDHAKVEKIEVRVNKRKKFIPKITFTRENEDMLILTLEYSNPVFKLKEAAEKEEITIDGLSEFQLEKKGLWHFSTPRASIALGLENVFKSDCKFRTEDTFDCFTDITKGLIRVGDTHTFHVLMDHNQKLATVLSTEVSQYETATEDECFNSKAVYEYLNEWITNDVLKRGKSTDFTPSSLKKDHQSAIKRLKTMGLVPPAQITFRQVEYQDPQEVSRIPFEDVVHTTHLENGEQIWPSRNTGLTFVGKEPDWRKIEALKGLRLLWAAPYITNEALFYLNDDHKSLKNTNAALKVGKSRYGCISFILRGLMAKCLADQSVFFYCAGTSTYSRERCHTVLVTKKESRHLTSIKNSCSGPWDTNSMTWVLSVPKEDVWEQLDFAFDVESLSEIFEGLTEVEVKQCDHKCMYCVAGSKAGKYDENNQPICPDSEKKKDIEVWFEGRKGARPVSVTIQLPSHGEQSSSQDM